MRILYILSGTEIAGGATKSFLTLMNAARDAGHEVAVVCNDDRGIFQYLKAQGVTTVCAPYRFASLPTVALTLRDIVRFIPRFVRDRIANPKAGKKILEFATSFRPDIIHENTSVTGVGYYVARRLSIPLIIHIREYADRDFGIYLLNYRRRLRYGKTYPVAITKDLARYRCDRLGYGKTARVIYNGIIDSGSVTYDSNKHPYFLYAGRVEPNKGIEDLIDAYLAYRKESPDGSEGLQLKIAGTWTRAGFYERLRQKISDSGYQDDIIWLGECKDMDSLYSGAAATVIPSWCEGFGRIPPEAMAKGSLCVMRDSGGLREQLDNGVELTGAEIALRFSSVAELHEILGKIADDYISTGGNSSTFAGMIRRSQLTVEALYSKKVYCDKFLTLYKDIEQQQTHQ